MKAQKTKKSVAIIHSLADARQVNELCKQLKPLEEAGKLSLWRHDEVGAGQEREKALREALAQADMILIWVSADLWDENSVYELLKQNQGLIPGNCQVAPAIARASNWEDEPFLKKFAADAIPADRQPVPAEQGSRRDAWFAAVAREVARRLGLPVSEVGKAPPFWKRRLAKLVAAAVILLLALIAVARLINQEGEKTFLEETGANKPKEAPKGNACNFPDTFDPKTLYIIIPRFEDHLSGTQDEQAYGPKLVSLIDNIKSREKLAIKICSRWDTTVNQRDDARQILENNYADLVIWGKVRKFSNDKKAGDIGLVPVPSRTLIEWAGGKLDEPRENVYQENVSFEDVEEGLLFMGDDEFENWLVDMYNLKVGKKVPDFYYIKDDWPKTRKIQGFLNQGKNFFELNKYEEALSSFKRAIEMDSIFSEGYYQAGRASYELKHYEESVKYCSRAIEQDSTHKNAHNIRGLCYEISGQYQKAIDDYSRAIAIDPSYSAAYNNRGLAKKQLKNYEEAIKDYDSALIYDPLSFHALANRGVALARLERTAEALRDFTGALEINPFQEVILTNRGYTYYLLQQYNRAIKDCTDAIGLKPEYANAFAVRGIARSALGHFQEALMDLNYAIELDSASSLFFYYRGQAYERQKQYREAAEDYAAAITINDNYHDAYLGHGRVKNQLRQPAGAIDALKRAREIRPENAETYYELGQAYKIGKQFEQAAQMYDEAIRRDSIRPGFYRQRAGLNLRTTRLRQALKDYWEAYTLANPETWWLWLALASGILLISAWMIRKRIKRT